MDYSSILTHDLHKILALPETHRISTDDLLMLTTVCDGADFRLATRSHQMTSRLKHKATALLCLRNLDGTLSPYGNFHERGANVGRRRRLKGGLVMLPGRVTVVQHWGRVEAVQGQAASPPAGAADAETAQRGKGLHGECRESNGCQTGCQTG